MRFFRVFITLLFYRKFINRISILKIPSAISHNLYYVKSKMENAKTAKAAWVPSPYVQLSLAVHSPRSDGNASSDVPASDS